MEEKIAYKMRRSRQAMKADEIECILEQCTHGTLALASPTGYPYALPISYAFSKEDNAIYFHSALEGHKIASIRNSDKASFSTVALDDVIPSKFTTAYKSVIAFGTIKIVVDEGEKKKAIVKIAKKYSPMEKDEDIKKEIESTWNHFCIIKLSIESLSGKKGKELLD